jgi:DNA-binding NarL/FixJ family response regulator
VIELESSVLGRDDELAAIATFLADGPSPAAALVLEGEAGIGKTTLWLRAVEQAADSYRVLSARPAEADEQLAFAGLGDLLSGVLDQVLAGLPPPQRAALEVALMLADRPQPPPDRATIAFAFLTALRILARERPVALAVDDVQWLDPPSAELVRFAARRLDAEPVRMLFARRGDGRGPAPLELDRATRLVLGPMGLGALHDLLHARLGASLPRPTLRRLHEASGGNAFYALEIGRALVERGEPGGRLPVPERLLSERLRALPYATQEALLVVALSSDPTLERLEAALGAPADLEPALAAKVLEVQGERVRLAHPLFATAVQQQAGPERTRGLHLVLARHAGSGEERALHLALGTRGTSAEAAGELVAAARAARARGAPIAAAEHFDHALRLSPPSQPERSGWETERAQALFEAGDPGQAAQLLTRLRETLPPGHERAAVLWQLTKLSRSTGAPPAQWLEVAGEALGEASGDVALEAALHGELAWATLFVNDLGGALEYARAGVRLAERLDDPEVGAQAIDALAYMELTAGIRTRPELIERALELEREAAYVFVENSPSFGYGFKLGLAGEFAAARSHLQRAEGLARARGDEAGLAVLCGTLATVETAAGDWRRAEAFARESMELAAQTGVNWHESLHARALLDAHLGRVEPALAAARELVADAEQGGSLVYLVRSLSLLGFLELSRGEWDAARDSLVRATDAAAELGIGEPGMLRCVPDCVETLAARGEPGRAEELIERFDERAAALGRQWARATADRCRGVILAARGDPAGAVAVLERACAGHRAQSAPFELGRTLLALGSAQRRARQRRSARASLEEALAIFERLGAPLWAGKARAEIARIGGRTPVGERLTPAEQRIADLVATGLKNREVAAELVVAVHTVEAALTRIYSKLGVRSRTELVRRLAEQADRPVTGT